MDKKKRNKEIKFFDHLASAWKGPNTRYWEHFGNRLVELAEIHPGANVLDIGSGRGASLFPAAAQVGQRGSVTGIDLSEGMIRETWADIKKHRLDNAHVLRMDAENMAWKNGSFDFVISGFSLGRFSLNDVMRVLKSGGRAGFSLWEKEDCALRGLYRDS
ncbi:MAG: class I SAM-dependent methyltransferase [Chloroflexi bacterium]|nr:class I SAM-dependent methyltransferase [Chloroflexota bacterium]